MCLCGVDGLYPLARSHREDEQKNNKATNSSLPLSAPATMLLMRVHVLNRDVEAAQEEFARFMQGIEPKTMPDQRPILWTTAVVPSADRSGRTATGRALALQLLMALGGTGWTIEADGQGKPVAHGPFARHVSIAHSRDMVAAAASVVGPIGVDVEYRNPARDLDRLAEAAYGVEECRAVALSGLSAFYRIWTVREAISKATGDGMALVTDGTDRVPAAAMADGTFAAARDDWLLAHDVIAQDFSLALAVHVASPQHRRAIQAHTLAGLRAA
jgi:phosphopantetheinyl transferase